MAVIVFVPKALFILFLFCMYPVIVVTKETCPELLCAFDRTDVRRQNFAVSFRLNATEPHLTPHASPFRDPPPCPLI